MKILNLKSEIRNSIQTADGYTHMRTDLEMFMNCENSADGRSSSLRFYTWHPTAVSFGRYQRPAAINMEAAMRLGLDIVRRPSGGGAVLHEGDLSFAWVVSKTIAENLRGAYEIVSSWFLTFFRELGIDASAYRPNETFQPAAVRGTVRKDACFSEPSAGEITVNGKKAAGWAAKCGLHAILVHGTFYVDRPNAVHQRLIFGHSTPLFALRDILPDIDTPQIAGELSEIFEAGRT